MGGIIRVLVVTLASLALSPLCVFSQAQGLQTDASFEINGQLVTIQGTGTIVYQVLKLNSSGSVIVVPETIYTKPVFLERSANENRSYVVEAWLLDASGSKSTVSRSAPVYLHGVTPDKPIIASPQLDQSLAITREKRLVVTLFNPDPGYVYRYAIRQDGKPDRKAEYYDGIVLEATTGEENKYRIGIAAISRADEALVSEALEFVVMQDCKPPAKPVIKGVQGGEYVRAAVQIEIEGEGTIEYRLKASEGQSDKAYAPYTGKIVVPVLQGREIAYELYARAVDNAGNISEPAGPVVFVMDAIDPETPVVLISGKDEQRFEPVSGTVKSRQDVLIKAQGANDNVFYRRYEKSSAEPDTNIVPWSPLQTGHEISIPENEEKMFVFEYRSQDEAENVSSTVKLAVFIDKKIPPVPDKPKISRNDNRGTISWERTEGIQVLADSQDVWQIYKTPVRFELSLAKPVFTLRYRAYDETENHSLDAVIELRYKPIAAQPRLEGVIDNASVKSGAVFSFSPTQEGASIRYRIGETPLDVDEQANIYSGSLKLEAEPGAERFVCISYRQFMDGFEASPLQYVRVLVDNRLPGKPQANLPDGNSSFFATQPFLFSKPVEGERIFYKLVKTPLSLDQLHEIKQKFSVTAASETVFSMKDYLEFDGKIMQLGSDFNKANYYGIQAIAVDKAGNTSEMAAVWNILIHEGIVFVTTTVDKISDGGIFKPVNSVADGIKLLGKAGGTIVVSEGQFALRPIDTIASIHIQGGFDYTAWQVRESQTEAATVLYPSQTKQAYLFKIAKDSVFSVHNLFLLDSGMKLQSLIIVQDAKVSISQSLLGIGPSTSAIEAKNASIQCRDSRLSIQDGGASSVIKAVNSSIDIASSILEYAELPPSLARRSKSARYTLLDLESCTTSISKATLRPKGGLATNAINVQGGAMSVKDSELFAGAGEESAQIVIASDADMQFDSCTLVADKLTALSVLVRSSGGSLKMNNSTLNMSGARISYGFILRGLDTALKANTFTGKAGSFMIFSSLSDCNARFESLDLKLSSDNEAYISRSLASTLNIEDSSLLIGAKKLMAGIQTLEGSKLQMSGTRIESSSDGPAFYVSQGVGLLVDTCILSGWNSLLRVVSELSQTPLDYKSLQDVELIQSENLQFTENQFQRGL